MDKMFSVHSSQEAQLIAEARYIIRRALYSQQIGNDNSLDFFRFEVTAYGDMTIIELRIGLELPLTDDLKKAKGCCTVQSWGGEYTRRYPKNEIDFRRVATCILYEGCSALMELTRAPWEFDADMDQVSRSKNTSNIGVLCKRIYK